MPKPTTRFKAAAVAASTLLVLSGCATGTDVYERTGITPALAPDTVGAAATTETTEEPYELPLEDTDRGQTDGKGADSNTTTVTVTATAVAVIPQSAINEAMKGQLLVQQEAPVSAPAEDTSPEITWSKDPQDEVVGGATDSKGKKSKLISIHDTPPFTIADDDGECLDEVAEYRENNNHPVVHYRGVPRDEVTVTYLREGRKAGEKTITVKKGVTALDIVDTTVNSDAVDDVVVTVTRGDRPSQSCVIDD
ncbi:hypothetical protein ACFSSC_11620 [Corynebacterium mendelii]|uniref:Uncharacterized protein n=1 Tax=Corynebacterium mendelii TaxID=2765362 RepID=A0A939DYJ4_9CORY|nr:hypothetical protein [Corynebacterium mendelii]MBN9643600.1 hypothetical protein [Corynebacterium mendelii]